MKKRITRMIEFQWIGPYGQSMGEPDNTISSQFNRWLQSNDNEFSGLMIEQITSHASKSHKNTIETLFVIYSYEIDIVKDFGKL